MDASSAPRVYPWTLLGLAVGAVAAVVIALAAWGRASEVDVTAGSVAIVSTTTVLFGTIIGLAVGQFIRVAGIVTAWRPSLPTVLDAPTPSSNGHGGPSGEGHEPVRNGALFAVLSLVGAVLAGPVVVPLLPAPFVLGLGALALDERTWVRMVGSAGVFVAAFSLAVFLVNAAVGGSARGPVVIAAVVAIGIAEVLVVRRIRPRR